MKSDIRENFLFLQRFKQIATMPEAIPPEAPQARQVLSLSGKTGVFWNQAVSPEGALYGQERRVKNLSDAALSAKAP